MILLTNSNHTIGSIVQIGYFQQPFKGAWVNVSISLGYPNGTVLPLEYLVVSPTDDPSICQNNLIQSAGRVHVITPGIYTALWRQTIWFPKFTNTTADPVMCWGGAISMEVSEIQKTFAVVGANTSSTTSSVQPTSTPIASNEPLYQPTHNVTATWNPEPTGKLYFVSYSDSIRTASGAQRVLLGALSTFAAGLLLEVTRLYA